MLSDQGILLSGEALEIAMRTVDENGDGMISYEEFVEWKKKSSFDKLSLEDEALELRKSILTLFAKHDVDNNGIIN